MWVLLRVFLQLYFPFQLDTVKNKDCSLSISLSIKPVCVIVLPRNSPTPIPPRSELPHSEMAPLPHTVTPAPPLPHLSAVNLQAPSIVQRITHRGSPLLKPRHYISTLDNNNLTLYKLLLLDDTKFPCTPVCPSCSSVALISYHHSTVLHFEFRPWPFRPAPSLHCIV